MNLGWISLAALFLIILISVYFKTNVGILAIGFSWIIGHLLFGLPLSQVAAGFPTHLFLLLLGVTFLFNHFKLNGTLSRLAGFAMRSTGGHRGMVPVVFFALAVFFAAIGPGNIGAVALLAPLAMEMAAQTGISAFLMTILVVAGANAGTFSPFSPTGLIAGALASRAGLEMHPWTKIFLPSFFAQTFIALSSYAIFGGIALWRKGPVIQKPENPPTPENWTRTHWLSLSALGVFVLGVSYFEADIGLLALILAAALSFLKPSDLKKTIAEIPWDAILMVCGVSTLVSVMEATGGMGLFTDLLARLSNASNVTGIIAFTAGVLSAFSSSSGVVMPAFIPTVPGLVARLQGADPAAIVASINVGSHVVDVSPLSTLGALCLASAGANEDKSKLFRHLLVYGLSLSVYGAIVCYFIF